MCVTGQVCINNFFLFVLEELWHLRNSLPDRVVVHRIEERLSALGNCIACNDYESLAHVDLDKVNYLLAIGMQFLDISISTLITAIVVYHWMHIIHLQFLFYS